MSVLWGVLLLLATSQARETEPALIDGWMVDRWTVEDGLPLDHVRDMAIDTDGFVWFATFDGLARFDGRSMQVMRQGNVPELPGSRLPFVEADPRGGIWALSEDGDLIRMNGDSVQTWPREGPLLKGYLNRFTTLDGQPYVFGKGGVLRLDASGPVQVVEPRRGASRVVAVDVAPDGTMWFTDELNGLFRLGEHGPEQVVSSRDAGTVTHLPDGRRLFGSDGKIYFVGDDGQLVALEGGTGDSATCEIALDGDGSLLIRTERGWFRDDLDHQIGTGTRTGCWISALSQGGRWRADARQVLLNDAPILRSARAIVGMELQGEALWLITEGAGVLRVRPRWIEDGGLGEQNINAVLASRDGTVWAGARDNGLWRLPESTRISTGEGWRKNQVLSLVNDAQGDIFVGNDFGVCRVQGEACDYVFTGINAVRGMHFDPSGTLWAGTEQGLFTDVLGKPTSVLVDGSIIEEPRVFADGGEGELWVGTSRSGVVQIREGATRSWTTEDGLTSNRIRSFWVDGGDVWVGTGDGGICRLRPSEDAVSCVTTRQGLHDDCVHALLPDEQGRLWMSTNQGLVWVDAQHLVGVVDGTRATVQSTVLGEAHGMRDREANGGLGSVASIDDEGRMWFATQAGVAVLDPSLVPVPEPPVVHLQEVRVDGEPVALGADLDLQKDQRQLEIAWTAAEMIWTEDLRYRFRLLPHDEQWRGPTTDADALWLGLPSGPFTVEVQAALAGRWSPSAVLSGERRPEFRETPYFLASLLGMALGLFGLAMWWRGRSQRLRQAELEDQVQRRTADLERTTEELQRQNEEIAAQNREIALQAKRLAELDALRKRLVADLSHELRTPLALVAGPLQDLGDNAPNLSPVNRQRLDVVQRSVSRLQDLIGQLFDLTRLEHGRLPLRARQADLATLIRAVSAGFRAQMAAGSLQLHTAVQGEQWLYFDADLIEKVLSNLLSNALKFTGAGGEVTVALVASEQRVRVEVSDTGIGVEPAALPRLFERFYQADQGDQRQFGGAGIGLALCRDLVELHGGEIGVHSKVGQGSTFWFELPRGVSHLAPADIDTSPAPETDRPVPAEVDAPEDAVTVLVVEDHPDMRHYLATHLRSHFVVVEADNGQTALEQLATARPAAVVSDVMMPVMDGLTLARTLKGDPATADIPVVLVSAKATEEDQRSGLEVADAYLCKPVRMRELLDTVARLTRSSLQPPAVEEGLGEADARLLERVLQVTATQLSESGFGVKELAKALALSPRQLQRTLRRLCSMSPSDFLRQQRMNTARALLQGGAYTTTAEVAAQVGLSPSYFSRLYSNWFGHPPSQDLPGSTAR